MHARWKGQSRPRKSITHYVPELKGTNWERYRVHQCSTIYRSLDNEETAGRS
ncbi:hypothetical protein OH492_15550 [Vibrio chagasii]|nr:hypothetical protein [Vibrio chagasii]